MSLPRHYVLPVLAMTLIVLASNIAVQFPVQGTVGALSLGDILTWGAFVYPFAFIVTDINNRLYGPVMARRVVSVSYTHLTLPTICSV